MNGAVVTFRKGKKVEQNALQRLMLDLLMISPVFPDGAARRSGMRDRANTLCEWSDVVFVAGALARGEDLVIL